MCVYTTPIITLTFRGVAQVMELSERSKALIESGDHAAAVPMYEQIYALMMQKLGESVFPELNEQTNYGFVRPKRNEGMDRK